MPVSGKLHVTGSRFFVSEKISAKEQNEKPKGLYEKMYKKYCFGSKCLISNYAAVHAGKGQ